MKLEYSFKHDILFKMFYVRHQDLLKRLVSLILGIPLESITEFQVINTEMPPEELSTKFCRLDINMKANGQFINLEIQVLSDKWDKTCYPSNFTIRGNSCQSGLSAA